MFFKHKAVWFFCIVSGLVLLMSYSFIVIEKTPLSKLKYREREHIVNEKTLSSIPNSKKPSILSNNNVNIAIGCAITSHGKEQLTTENIEAKFPFLKSLLPSFCNTVSAGFNYHFYASYDVKDPCFSKNEYMMAIYQVFNELVRDYCPPHVNVSLYFVRCNHNNNPAWAQNDAMMTAYMDHMDYYYRVNDDTRMMSPGWTESYIESLKSFEPPNIGVVGPLHRGGNEAILTYDFVHRTHIDIFGSYYPREFTDWWADNWISSVYGETRTMKLPSVRLIHTSEVGTRYKISPNKGRFLKQQVREDQAVLRRYLKAIEANKNMKSSNKKLVISMSLWGSKTRYSYGVLRNAQLVPIFFPGWTLRIYVEKPKFDGTTSFLPADSRIVSKLQKMGVEVVEVDHDESLIPPMMWRFLVADDESVDAFIVRDADCRLTDRDAIAVHDWLTNSISPFHCARDHPSHVGYALLGGLWGGKPSQMKYFMNVSWHELMIGLRTDYSQDMVFLASAVWPKFEKIAYCHDSFSCKKWMNARPFPTMRNGTEHLGQVFDAFGNVKDDDVYALLDKPVSKDCLPFS